MDFNIGSKIKKLRKARKLTLQDVARETGFSPALISQIENNNVSPPITVPIVEGWMPTTLMIAMLAP